MKDIDVIAAVRTPGEIMQNFTVLKKAVKEKVDQYAQIAYSGEGALKEMKKDRAELNSLITSLEERRKSVKEEFTKPLKSFEKEVKDVVALIEGQRDVLAGRIDTENRRLKEKKKKEILQFYQETIQSLEPDSFYDSFMNRIYDEKWENSSTPKKKWKGDILSALETYRKNVEILKAMDEPEFFSDALGRYQQSLDLRDGLDYIREKRRTNKEAELARIKAEAETDARAEARIRKAVENAEANARAETGREKAGILREAEKEKVRKNTITWERDNEDTRFPGHNTGLLSEEQEEVSAESAGFYVEHKINPFFSGKEENGFPESLFGGYEPGHTDECFFGQDAGIVEKHPAGNPVPGERFIVMNFRECDRTVVEELLDERGIWYSVI